MIETTHKNSPMTKEVWKEMFFKFYLPQKKLFIPLIIISLITAASEASLTYIVKLVVDEIMLKGTDAELWKLGLVFFGAVAVLVACIRIFILICGKLSTELMYQMRKACFNHLQKLSFSFYDKHAVGWLVSRVTSDCAKISDMIAWGTLDLFWGIPFIIGVSTVLITLNWKLGLLVLLVFPLLAWVSVYFRKIILESSRKVRRTNSALTATYNEGIAGVQTSKVLVREDQNMDEFKQESDQMFKISRANYLQSSAYYPLITIIASLGTGVALWSGGSYVMGGAMTLGSLVAFMAYTRDISEPMLIVAESLTNLQRITACAERVLGLLNVSPEITDSEKVKAMIQNAYGQPTEDGGDAVIKEIEFKETCFAYDASKPVLKNFNFKLEAGKTVALVGPTGSGKSTIVNLMCRFYEPTSGHILINGVDYRERSLGWLQSNLGIVLQTPFLFSGTIKSNIQYGNLSATDEEIIEAAKIVNVHDMIMEMEHGYDTVVEEGGNNLSTGQKQLLSFARAIIANPQIFVMDEATSSVDTHTEYLIQQGLQKVLENRTSFVIAHRLSTIRAADYILVIENGELTEIGNHDQLIQQRGHYFELYNKQFAGTTLSSVA